MGLPDISPNTDYRIATAGLRDATTDVPEPGWFDNFIPATLAGVPAGLSAAGRMFGDLGVAAGKGRMIEARGFAPWQEEEAARAIEQSKVEVRPYGDAAFAAVQKWAEPDPAFTGFFGRTGHGVVRGFTIVGLGSLAGGPQVGAALLGGTEAHATFTSMREQGVDERTALKASLIQGGTAFAGAAFPMTVSGSLAGSLGFKAAVAAEAGSPTLAAFYRAAATAAKATGGHWASRIGTGIGINNAMGMSSRGLTSSILEDAGYKEMAQQYRVLDAEAIVADTVLGAVFGSWHEATNIGEARKNLKPSEKPGPLDVDHALEVQVHAEESRGAMGVPRDLETANLDAELQARARDALVKGNDFDLTPDEALRIVENSLVDPVKVQFLDEFAKTLYDQFGVRAREPQPLVKDIFAPTGEAVRRIVPEVAPVGLLGESVLGKHLDPSHLGMLDQIAAHDPNAKVILPDGTEVAAIDARPAMEEAMAKEIKEAGLIDAAIACFLRGAV